MSRNPVISIITVAHNDRGALLRGLGAVQSGTEVPAELIVVDNGSTDNTAAAVRHAFRDVALIRRDEPLPAPAALNLGAASARAPWLLFLDPGLEPLGDAVRTLLEHAAGPRLCTGRTLFNGADDGRTIEAPPGLLGTAALALSLPFDPERLPRLDRAIGGAVPALTPRMLLIERGLWDILDGFDERLPTADLSVRARALGARPTLVPDARMAAAAPERPTGRHAAPEPPPRAARLATTALLTERMAFAHRHLTPGRARAMGLILSAAALTRSIAGEPWLSIHRRRTEWLDAHDPMPFIPVQTHSFLRRDLPQP